jgi:magnesium transporter
MITYYFRTIKDDTLKEIPEIRTGVWIHAVQPTETELNELAERLSLDMSILEDAQDFFEVPRLERSGGVTYFFTRYPFNEKTEDTDTAPLLIVVGESFVFTISVREVPQFMTFFEGKTAVRTTQKTKLFIQIMQVITQSFERQLIGLRRSVQKDRVKLRKISNQEILRFVNYEHKLNDMVASVLPTNVSLQQIIVGNYMQVYDDDRELVEDVRIDNAQIVDSARSLLKTIQNVRSAAEAILTNNLNNRIKTLTVLTVLLTIPTIISSLYGMNVPLPLAEEPYAFVFVVTLVVSVMSLGVWYLKKNEWL